MDEGIEQGVKEGNWYRRELAEMCLKKRRRQVSRFGT